MLLEKRPRPPMRRTTSVTGITVDLSNVEGQEPTDLQNPQIKDVHAVAATGVVVGPQVPAVNNINIDNMNLNMNMNMNMNNFGYQDQHRFLAMLSPRNNHPRNSSASRDFVGTAHFLRTCGLCKGPLASGRDIYMYRGDAAFCSLECREQQMKQDERVEKCKAVASKKDKRHAFRTASTSKASGKSQTVAAA